MTVAKIGYLHRQPANQSSYYQIQPLENEREVIGWLRPMTNAVTDSSYTPACGRSRVEELLLLLLPLLALTSTATDEGGLSNKRVWLVTGCCLLNSMGSALPQRCRSLSEKQPNERPTRTRVQVLQNYIQHKADYWQALILHATLTRIMDRTALIHSPDADHKVFCCLFVERCLP